jgi:hypothetical protein
MNINVLIHFIYHFKLVKYFCKYLLNIYKKYYVWGKILKKHMLIVKRGMVAKR